MPAPHPAHGPAPAAHPAAAAAGAVALLGAEVAAVAVLWGLCGQPWAHVGWHDPVSWLAATAPADALGALLLRGALVYAVWLAAGSLLYVVLAARRLRPAARAAGRWLPGPVRRIMDRAVAGALMAAVSAGPAAAAVAPPLPAEAPPDAATVTGRSAVPGGAADPRSVLLPPGLAPPPRVADAPDPAGTPDPGGSPDPAGSPDLDGSPDSAGSPEPAGSPDPAAGRAPPPASGSQRSHVVRPGDNLWRIAADDLAAHGGRRPAVSAVHAHWLRVIDANVDHLRSGNPDLIHPGERIVLPPLDTTDGASPG